MQRYEAWVLQLCPEQHPTLVAAAGYVGTLFQSLPPLPQDHLSSMSPRPPFPLAQQPTGLGATMLQQNPALTVDTSKDPISKEDPHRKNLTERTSQVLEVRTSTPFGEDGVNA